VLQLVRGPDLAARLEEQGRAYVQDWQTLILTAARAAGAGQSG
jgi:hypothetical protein